jgi:hypothetical protein
LLTPAGRPASCWPCDFSSRVRKEVVRFVAKSLLAPATPPPVAELCAEDEECCNFSLASSGVGDVDSIEFYECIVTAMSRCGHRLKFCTRVSYSKMSFAKYGSSLGFPVFLAYTSSQKLISAVSEYFECISRSLLLNDSIKNSIACVTVQSLGISTLITRRFLIFENS